jgi:outer membrane receptor for ferrienterochelin and colicins
VNVGFDFRPNLEGWVISGSAWHTSLTDLINVSGSGLPNPDAPATFSYENVANAYTQGVELSAHMKLSKGTYLDVGYTGLDARDVTRNRALEGRSPHTFNASIASKYRPIGLEGVLRATYRSPRPYYGSSAGAVNVIGDGSTATIMSPGYVDLDLQLTYTRYFFKIFFNASNLLNSGDANYNPRPPRTLVAGLQVEL